LSQADVQRRLVLAVASAAIQHASIDNLIAPTRGYSTAAEVRYSAPFIASDPSLTFIKATGDASWYHALWSGGVFAARLRGGHITAGDTGQGTKLPPPQERLYAGGANSVRGFQQNELGSLVYLLNKADVDSFPCIPATMACGPKPDSAFVLLSKKGGSGVQRSVPVGGNNLIVINAELRIRDPFFPGLIEYVPFVDAGQVWTTTPGSPQFTLGQLQVTPGLGLRYFSPVGPIQLNVGYNRYTSRAGPAYFAPPGSATSVQRPLICVTPPGATPIPVQNQGGQLVQPNVSQCPSSFVPTQSSNFFSRLTLTLSIGTDF
jgi:outer membrane protein insertion porin family/translocation and assembly module TamA